MCRIWVYRGEEYTEAPVAMIVEAILREVFGGERTPATVPVDYDEVGRDARSDNTSPHCCSPEALDGCCDSSEKQACCGEPPQDNVCGCQ